MLEVPINNQQSTVDNVAVKQTFTDEEIEAIKQYMKSNLESNIKDYLKNTPPQYTSSFDDIRRVLSGQSELAGDMHQAGHLNKATLDFLLEDVMTVVSKDSSLSERALAGFFLINKPGKVVDRVYDGIGKKIDSVGDSTKGTGENITQGARYGERKISDETYGKLRRASPSSKIEREVNKNIDDIIGTEDFALPGRIIEKKLHADHIVSLKKIARMEGFETLTYNQQKEIANFIENFICLSEAANTSKGSKSFADWYIYKKENIPVNPVFREKMTVKEKELEIESKK
ncbi:hypothetical protein JOC75_000789 [Metabacillus crassostreae]|uniref:hypothetical protein n=1 Tax=Metabacillus crassostreae TaxID=929098 RepID=UPI001EF7F133|nr:hypothetical protein [Metabacillus crassostreae]MBM7602819.1 hypothetical protein [Metabacillus crassostreae]